MQLCEAEHRSQSRVTVDCRESGVQLEVLGFPGVEEQQQQEQQPHEAERTQ